MESFQPISEWEIIEMSSMLPSDDVSVVMGQVQGMLEQADSASLDIAVTGEAGAGKSSFINAFLGLLDDDAGAAETGVTETTQVASSYAHPTAPNVHLWDLPGIGTPTFQPECYLEKVDLLRYDFFIILSSERFRECHTKLAHAISQSGKTFYFVRNKIDRELRANARQQSPHVQTDSDVLEKIRTDCLQNIKRTGLMEPKVFLMSCFEPQCFDLPLLQSTLLEDLEGLKRRALLLSLPSCTTYILEQKKQELSDELWKVAMSACLDVFMHGDAIGGVVPKLMDTLRVYQRIFSLDQASLQRLAAITGTTYEELYSEVKSSLGRDLTSGTLEWLLSKAGPVPEILIRPLLSRVPVLGTAFQATSFMVAHFLLKTSVTHLSQDLERVIRRALQSRALSSPVDHGDHHIDP